MKRVDESLVDACDMRADASRFAWVDGARKRRCNTLRQRHEIIERLRNGVLENRSRKFDDFDVRAVIVSVAHASQNQVARRRISTPSW